MVFLTSDYLRCISHLLATLNATIDILIYLWKHADINFEELDVAGLIQVQVK